jgi:hypothetical protein
MPTQDLRRRRRAGASGRLMANSRTTYQDRSGGDGATASGDTFTWVSLRDPSPEELASVQRQFGLPEPLVEQLGAVTKRPTLEVVGERLFAVVKTVRWEAAEDEISSGEVQRVLGDGVVGSVDRDAAVLEQVRQDLQADPELVGAELAAVLPCVVDHAADSYGPVLGALNNAVEDVEEAVFSPDRARPTEGIYRLSRQVLEFRRAVARAPSCSTAWPPSRRPPPASGSSSAIASGAPTCSTWSNWPTALVTCSRPTGPRSWCARTTTCAGSRPGWRSGHPDPAGRHLRDELPAPAGARVDLRLPAGASGHGPHLHGAVPGVPAQRLAVAGRRSARGARPAGSRRTAPP